MTSNNNLVYIRTFPRPSAQGRTNYRHDGVLINKTKAKNANTQYKVPISTKHKRLKTGLTHNVVNPYYVGGDTKADKQKLDTFKQELPMEWHDIFPMKKVPLQYLMEIKHGVKRNTYTAEKPPFKKPKDYNSTYMQRLRIILNDGLTILNRDVPDDELRYHVCLESDFCANSFEEVEPSQDFYISRVNEEEEKISRRKEIVEEAIHHLYLLKNKTSPDIKVMVGKVLGLVKGSQVSNEAVNNQLSSFISTPGSKQLENIATFNEWYDKTKTPDGLAELKNTAFLRDLVTYRVVTNYQGEYVWHNAPSNELKVLGKSEKHALLWLSDPDRKDFTTMLEDELNTKKRFSVT